MNIFATKLFAAMGPVEIIGIVVLGLLLVALFVYPSLTNKKKQKQIAELYKSVDVGDKVKTVGGVIGTVLEVNEINALESEFVLETGVGDNKTTMVFDMQAIYQNLTKMAHRHTASTQAVENESDSDNADASNEADASSENK